MSIHCTQFCLLLSQSQSIACILGYLAGSCKLCGARGSTLGSGGRTLPTAGLTLWNCERQWKDRLAMVKTSSKQRRRVLPRMCHKKNLCILYTLNRRAPTSLPRSKHQERKNEVVMET